MVDVSVGDDSEMKRLELLLYDYRLQSENKRADSQAAKALVAVLIAGSIVAIGPLLPSDRAPTHDVGLLWLLPPVQLIIATGYIHFRLWVQRYSAYMAALEQRISQIAKVDAIRFERKWQFDGPPASDPVLLSAAIFHGLIYLALLSGAGWIAWEMDHYEPMWQSLLYFVVIAAIATIEVYWFLTINRRMREWYSQDVQWLVRGTV